MAAMSADLTAPGVGLAASAAALSSATGALTTAIRPAASVAALATATGALSTSVRLAAAPVASTAVFGALSTATAALTTTVRLAATPTDNTAATGALTTAVRLAGSATDVVAATAALSIPKPVSASVQATASAAASLTTGIRLAAQLTGASTIAGSIDTATALVANAVIAAAASADLSTYTLPFGKAGPFILVPEQGNRMLVAADNTKMTPLHKAPDMALLGRYTQQPNEVIDYPVDFTDWMAERVGDSIASYTVAATAGISIATHRRDGNVVTVVLSGGTSGTSYKATVRITTAAGLVKEAEFSVKIKEV